MKTSTKRRTVCNWAMPLFMLTFCTQPALRAGIPAVDVRSDGRLRSDDRVVGYQFTVHDEITITELGKFDGNANGILDDTQPSKVTVWDLIGQTVASTTIEPAAMFDHGAFYSPIPPTTLGAGSYVIGVQTFADQEPYLGNSRTANSNAIRWDEGRRAGSSDARFLTTSTRGAGSYFGPSFKIDEPIALFDPPPRAVFQRDEQDIGRIRLQGAVSENVDRVEARAVLAMDGMSGATTTWQPIDMSPGVLDGELEVPAGGWYRIETRAYQGDDVLGEAFAEQIGVGDVFITAGQSNSANHGAPRIAPQSDFVSALDAAGRWQHASDPQPIATGAGGSPWPTFGDLMVEQRNVPIGIISVGWGGTTVGQWLPGASGPDSEPLYNRLQSAIEHLGPHGASAVLWHQGESDSAFNTSTDRYAERMQQVIAKSREDAGYDIPWVIAKVAFLPSTSARAEARVIAGQEQVIANDPLVFAGPPTDDLTGADWRWDTIHFNEAGLREHAERWVTALNDMSGGASTAPLRAGDADRDLDFDQLDLVQVQVAGTYLTGLAATWGEGDWDGAPGGDASNPPAGDGLFNQFDIIAAQQAATYLTGPYAVVQAGGQLGDGQTSVVYNAATGEISVDTPAGVELTSINIDSATNIFTAHPAQNLGGSFDNDGDGNIFKATFGASFGSLSFGNVATAGLSEQFLLGDLTIVGSLAGGGDLGNVDLLYLPEPGSAKIFVFGLLFLVRRIQRR